MIDTAFQVLALLKMDPAPGDPDAGSNSLHWWRRRESNPRRLKTLTG